MLYTWGDQGKHQSYLSLDNIYIYVFTMTNVILVTVLNSLQDCYEDDQHEKDNELWYVL